MSSTRNDLGIKCFYCGKSGHIARNCHKNKLDETRHKKKKHVGHFLMKMKIRSLDCLCLNMLSLLRMMKKKLGLWILNLPLTWQVIETSLKILKRLTVVPISTLVITEDTRLKDMEIFLWYCLMVVSGVFRMWCMCKELKESDICLYDYKS